MEMETLPVRRKSTIKRYMSPIVRNSHLLVDNSFQKIFDVRHLVIHVQIVGIAPPPVGKQYRILLIAGIVTLVIGVLLIAFNGGSTTSGPMAVSDGCCAGCLIMIPSFAMIAIGLSQTERPAEILYHQE